MQRAGLSFSGNARTKQVFKEYLEQYIEFHHELLIKNIADHRIGIYQSHPELLYLVHHDLDLPDADIEDLSNKVIENWLDFVEQYFTKALKKDLGSKTELEDQLADFFALLFHFTDHSTAEDYLKEFADIYESVSNQADRSNSQEDMMVVALYKQLKLYSCWYALHHGVDEVPQDVLDILNSEVQPATSAGKALPTSMLQKFNYPSTTPNTWNGLWALKSSYIWETGFDEEIADKLNDDGSYYEDFHEELINRK